MYSGRIYLSDKLEISLEKEIISHSENKQAIRQVVFGDFDGDGELELGVLYRVRKRNRIQFLWVFIQKDELGIDHFCSSLG